MPAYIGEKTVFCPRDDSFVNSQGDRFGGALDAAAKQFSKAFDSGMLPMEFVNKMKKDGKLIMGIGHRVKSVSSVFNPTSVPDWLYIICCRNNIMICLYPLNLVKNKSVYFFRLTTLTCACKF